MNNVLVTGANGQLGSEIKSLASKFKSYNFFFVKRDEIDVSNANQLVNFIKKNKINSIINCAAYTKVDLAEDDIEYANLINHISVKKIGEIAKKYDLKLIHISTDYVFNGKAYMPYLEDHKTDPKSVYGRTKLDGENALRSLGLSNTVIIRTAWVYSEFGNNFVKTMLKLGTEREQLNIIDDQLGSPTYAKDLAFVILSILSNIKNTEVEIYHYTNEGVCSWYDFAKTIFEINNINCNVKPIPSLFYKTKATRPHYSVLNKQKIKEKFSIEIPYWKDSLEDCLKKIVK
ncbi:dTDP-4-dehydrorhamnose reductase [Aquimarina agarilytica]|uniref:dTDP-4-dehydrorhamnose reductase n=1 Tax=Aquimarina agarilytica TaxID=1087449 RepID=UPI0002D550CA|nr:dTDP-4-dehydrorhamnose reductase [Aquimarina agarilytica]